jgi:hypothetical protein
MICQSMTFPLRVTGEESLLSFVSHGPTRVVFSLAGKTTWTGTVEFQSLDAAVSAFVDAARRLADA